MQAQLAPHWCQAAVLPLCHDALAGCHGAEHMQVLHITFWGTSVHLSFWVVSVYLPSFHRRLPQSVNARDDSLELPVSES